MSPGHQVAVANLAAGDAKMYGIFICHFQVCFSYGFLLMEILHQLTWTNPFLLRLHIFLKLVPDFSSTLLTMAQWSCVLVKPGDKETFFGKWNVNPCL